MTRSHVMAEVLQAADNTIDMLESALHQELPADGSDLAANTVLFATDQLAFALVRYRAEHHIPKS